MFDLQMQHATSISAEEVGVQIAQAQAMRREAAGLKEGEEPAR